MAKKLRRSWSPSGRPLVALLFFSWISVSDVAAATNGSLAINSPSSQQHKNDLCRTGSCQNNATCLGSAENPGVFTCLCPTGWTGRVCDVDIDECSDSLNRCQNGALCRNFPGGFQCYCVPGYLGEFCDMEANECLAQPCRNGATCLDKLNGYECSCTIGYTGRQCEVEINECEPNPCHNGGTCADFPAAYNCTCPLGFAGTNCEINIDNCEENPCRNGGRCVDGVNNFTCNCVETGFSGRFCESEIDDCASSPCQHNGSCKDIGKDYRCRCFDGYLGKNCEVDIDECTEPSPPCQNNATCYERSNVSLHIDRTLLGLDRAFSYENSAGYVCMCQPGFKGKNCEAEIDECESSPCLHGTCTDLRNAHQCTCQAGWQGGNCEKDIDECLLYGPCSQHGRCENTQGGFSCKCDAGFGGSNCSLSLTGCEEDVCADGLSCPSFPKCAEGATCLPFLSVEAPVPVHNFTCVCPVGRAGRFCQSSSVAAFAMDGFLQLLNQSLVNISFDFRTTLNDSLLITALEHTLIVAVQINKGRVEVVANDPDESRTVTFTRPVSDGKWYTMALLMEGASITALLRPTDLGFGGIPEKQTVQLAESTPTEMRFSEVFLGGVEHRVRITGTSFRSNMIGCMRDININGDVLIPVEMNSNTRRRQASVRGVCERKEQCSVNTCNRRGRCSDLWNYYECACDRPYYGLSCEKEIPPGTFAHENSSSSVLLSLTEPDRANSELRNQLSFRIRTLENNSAVFYLGSTDGNSFILLRLIKGRLVLSVKLSDIIEPIFGPHTVVSDGAYHYVNIERDQTMVQITVDNGQPTFGQLASGSPLKAELLLLGQILQPEGRKLLLKREKSSEIIGPGTERQVSPGNTFKGILQDFRLNGKLVPFFGVTDSDQLERLPSTYKDVTAVEVLQGVVSDNTCFNGPCRNSGTCEVTWNDFRCICPVAFRGKFCELSNFCLSNECPNSQAQCKKLEDDYECQASISFVDAGGYMTFVPTRTPSTFRKVSFRFRTRSTDSKNILSITSTKHELKIYIKNARIQIEYRLNSAPSAVTVDTEINDALWHNFTAEFLERQINILIDGLSFTQDILVADVSLNAILLEDKAYVQVGGHFIGCLDDIRLGRHLLPLFPVLKMHSALTLKRIVSIEKTNGVEYGCRAQDICRMKPCKHGKCVDLWNTRHCQCNPLEDGPLCDLRSKMDPLPELCAQLDCQNGGTVKCDEFSNAQTNQTTPVCECLDGYTGTQCETQVAQTAAPPDQLAIILGVTLSVAFLLLLIALTAFCITARRKRAERGTYSPNRQEHFGRVEMDYVLKPPPKEGLI